MDIIWFYILAVIPFLVGGILWASGREVVWIEWLGGTAIAFATAGIFHFIAIHGQTRDVETWSGQLTSGRHIPRWKEYYEEAVYRTETYVSGYDSKGRAQYSTREVFDHWRSCTRWHDDEFQFHSNINTDYEVEQGFFQTVSKSWNGVRPVGGRRTTYEHASRMVAGDPNDYLTENKTGIIWPVTKQVDFENRIKAAPTTFSYACVPKTIKVFDYPENNDPFRSNRLLGSATLIDTLLFDQMNARLGPIKKVNVILVGFGAKDSMMAQWQEAAWIGGKKNDVVICWGGLNDRPDWVRAFGWTENKTCLRTLESIILEKGASNQTLPLIETEIKADYKIKDWHKFDYIRIPVPARSIITYLIVGLMSQAGFWWWASHNEFSKYNEYR